MVVKSLIFVIIVNLAMAETVRYGGELFLDGQDARNAGMGGYSVSLAGGRNPALLFRAQESSVHFSHKNKFAGLSNISSISYLYHRWIHRHPHLLQSPIYFNLVNRSINNISDTRSAWIGDGYSEPKIGEIDYYKIKNISQNELGMKVSFMHKYDAIAIGISIKPTYLHLADYSAWGISNDIGAIIQLFEKKLDLSLRVEDILSINKWSTGRSEATIPLITVGGQIQLASILLGIEMGSNMMKKTPLYYHAGFEFHQQNEMVIFRGGISHNNQFSVGIGLNLKMIHIDYAYLVPHPSTPFEASQIVSVGIFLEKLNWIKGEITP